MVAFSIFDFSRDEADRVHKLVEKTMEGNAELYKVG